MLMGGQKAKFRDTFSEKNPHGYVGEIGTRLRHHLQEVIGLF